MSRYGWIVAKVLGIAAFAVFVALLPRIFASTETQPRSTGISIPPTFGS